MGIVGQGIQEQVGQRVAGQMRIQRHSVGIDQPRGIHAARGRLLFQMDAGIGGGLLQPQHAAGHRLQQAHPDIEYRLGNLPVVVEGAEDKTVLRQAAGGTAGRRPDRPRRIGGKIAVGQMHQLFAEKGLILERRHDGVGNQVIHEGRAGGAGIAQPGCLHGRRAVRENLQPRLTGMAAQIDGDIDFHLPQAAGDVGAVEGRKIVEPVEGLDQPGADGAVVAGPVGNADHLELRAVVALDQGRQLERHGMFANIRRDIGQPDAVVAVFFPPPLRRQRLGHKGPDRAYGALQLQRLVVAVAQKGERRGRAGDFFGRSLRHPRPVAQVERHHRPVGARRQIVRIQRHGLVIARQGLAMPFQSHQDGAAIVKDRGGARLERQGGIQCAQRFLESLLLRQDHAAVVQGLEIAGLRRQDLVIPRKRLVEALRRHQGMGQMIARGDVARVLPHRLVQPGDGLVIAPLLRLEKAQHVKGRKISGIGAQHLAIEIFRTGGIAGAVGRDPPFKKLLQRHRLCQMSRSSQRIARVLAAARAGKAPVMPLINMRREISRWDIFTLFSPVFTFIGGTEKL